MRKQEITVSLLLFLLLFYSACAGQGGKSVSLRDTITNSPSQSYDTELKIAVAGVISPRESFAYYQDLLDYISRKIGRPVKLVQRETYREVNDWLREKRVDAAFVCSEAYVRGHDEFGLELLVAPLIHGQTVYYSYIIVPADSGAQSFNDLRGARFAFTDPLSNSGTLAPTYRLARMNETPASFFSEYIYTYNHDKSIVAVVNKLVAGAAVDSLIWDYLSETRPELTSQTRIIEKLGPYGIPPVVVPKDLDESTKLKLKEVLVLMHLNPEGKKILEKLKIDKFVSTKDSDYDSIREMIKRVQ